MEFISEIVVERCLYRGEEVECYVPKINGVNVMGEGSYLFKVSVFEGIGFDNIKIAENILFSKLKELREFSEKNKRFFKESTQNYNLKISSI